MRTRKGRTEQSTQTHSWQVPVERALEPVDDGLDSIQLMEVAAHDLRNPISGILAASQYLLEDARSVLDEHQLALLGSIDSSGRTMLQVIDDMLELSKFESGKLRLHLQTTSLQPILNHAVLSSREVAGHKKVQVDLEAGNNLPLPPLDLDPVKIFHALDSLLTSTIKLVRPGSRIRVSISSRSGRATISLRGEGSGVSPATLRSLFHPLRTGRLSPSGVEVGTVLGLAKIRRIVSAHGGTIRVERGGENVFLIKVTFPLPQRTTAHRSAAGIG